MPEEVAASATTTPPVTPPVVPAADARPDFLLPKFKTIEEQAKGYAELEKKLGAPKPKSDAPQIPTTPEVPDLPDEAGISALVERAGLKEADIVTAFQEKGELTAEQYAAFKKQGITKGMVKEYLQAQVAIGQQMVAQATADAVAVVGSKEQLDNLLQWAGKGGIPASEVEALNAELAADPRKIVPITQRLLGIHTAAMGAGKAQPLVNGSAAAQPAGAFASQSDMLTAKKAAEKDPSLMASFRQRLALTPQRNLAGL